MSRVCIYLTDHERAILGRLIAVMERNPSWIFRRLLVQFSEELLRGYKSRLP